MSNLFPVSLRSQFNPMIGLSKGILCFILLAGAYLEGTYIERFQSSIMAASRLQAILSGSATPTGENNPGKNDSIGAFMTTNPNLKIQQLPCRNYPDHC